MSLLHPWGGKSAYTFLVGYSTYFKMLLVCHGSVWLKGDIQGGPKILKNA